MPVQDLYAGGMERGYPDALRAEAHQLVHPIPHLPRRLVRERDGKDMPGIHAAPVDQIGDPMGQHSRLAGARSCQPYDANFFKKFSLSIEFPE